MGSHERNNDDYLVERKQPTIVTPICTCYYTFTANIDDE